MCCRQFSQGACHCSKIYYQYPSLWLFLIACHANSISYSSVVTCWQPPGHSAVNQIASWLFRLLHASAGRNSCSMVLLAATWQNTARPVQPDPFAASSTSPQGLHDIFQASKQHLWCAFSWPGFCHCELKEGIRVLSEGAHPLQQACLRTDSALHRLPRSLMLSCVTCSTALQASVIRALWQMQVVNEVGRVRSEEALVAVLPLQPHSPLPAPQSSVLPEEQSDPPEALHPPEIISQPRYAKHTVSPALLHDDCCLQYRPCCQASAILSSAPPVKPFCMAMPWVREPVQLQFRGDSAGVIAASLVSICHQEISNMPLRLCLCPAGAWM